jgi:hypothetical protein
MITCSFFGGLGNNLFQLATVYNLHKKYGYELILPSSVDRGGIEKYNQSTELEISSLLENEFVYDDTKSHSINKYIHHDYYLNSTDFSYREIPNEDNLNYFGYFQSPLYFSDVDIPTEFKLKSQKVEEIKTTYESLFTKKNISLHYRLGGDRVSSRMQYFHKNVSLEYYSRALNQINEYNREEYNILVFSDNIQLCKEYLSPLNYEFTFIDNKNNNVLDFIMMSLCDINIVGNSTFSWWSAFMNQNRNSKVIVTEQEWFGPGYKHFNLKDVFPKLWIKI